MRRRVPPNNSLPAIPKIFSFSVSETAKLLPTSDRDRRETGVALTTRSSLLARLSEGGEVPWREFDSLYTPFLKRVAARCGLSGQDLDEAVQTVMVDLHGTFATFRYDRDRGTFKGYLKRVMVTTVSRMVRQRQRAGTPTAVPPDASDSGLESVWEQEYQQHLLQEALRQVRGEVDAVTFQAFDLYALQEVPVAEVARFLGISRDSVYQAKTRVTARLRAIVEELDKQ